MTLNPTQNLDALSTPLAKIRSADPIIAGPAHQSDTPAAPAASMPAGRPEIVKMTMRLDPELAGRARAAYLAAAYRTGVRSLSEWCANAIEKAVTAAETELNDGVPFGPIGIDVVPKGRLGRE